MQRSTRSRSRAATAESIASVASTAASRLRESSVRMLNADASLGMWAATANATSKAPTLDDIRRGNYGEEGWIEETQATDAARRRASVGSFAGKDGERGSQASTEWPIRRTSTGRSSGHESDGEQGGQRIATNSGGKRKRSKVADAFPALEEEAARRPPRNEVVQTAPDVSRLSQASDAIAYKDVDDNLAEGHLSPPATAAPPSRLPAYLHPDASGYIPPPKLPWRASMRIGLQAFWKWFLTPAGFLITLYGLNVVAWGGMLFLLLCNASPAMCNPTCDDINSPRRKWIEWDSQILNALFCVTGFGLVPWRFRDLWWLMVYRLGIRGRDRVSRDVGIRRLAGIHRSWFRLKGSDQLGLHVDIPNPAQGSKDYIADTGNPSLPIPVWKTPKDPLTSIRAPSTSYWKMDFVIWCNVWNTFLQACLCGFMWGMNR